VKQNYDILMTDSPTYDAHNPVQWTPDHVAKELKADAKTNKPKALEHEPTKGWAGLPVM
jgi:hypothetical protein